MNWSFQIFSGSRGGWSNFRKNYWGISS